MRKEEKIEKTVDKSRKWKEEIKSEANKIENNIKNKKRVLEKKNIREKCTSCPIMIGSFRVRNLSQIEQRL